METSLSPQLSYLCLFGVLVAFFLFVFGIRKYEWPRILLILTGSGVLISSVFFFLALNSWIIDPRFQTYRSFYYEIEEGMTRQQVIETLIKHYPRDGDRDRPTIRSDNEDQLGFFMNPEDYREPNCEGIFLKMKNGVVVQKTYSND
ncbi:MAG: hypothetical protein ISR39_10485 [Akkermansiaceae bacterium]|nr:hypothetical protein [Akkermansiaceae bacterium]OUV14215.1 MAG: hypothetical protein CBC46_06290 [Verrucomicrobiaceae bacterium TMED86]